MGQIQVKFDNQLKQSKIMIPLFLPADGELAGVNNPANVAQTNLYGIVAPLVKINDIVIEPEDVRYMRLSCESPFPSLDLAVTDSMHLIKGLENPSQDNEVRIQILPKFDNAYKKIDLTFYIVSHDEDPSSQILRFSCQYKVPDLFSSRIKCFGQKTTYELFEQIAQECKLGFATNVEGSGNDKRYMYCANNSYSDLMRSAIQMSGDAGNDVHSRVLYEYWVDFWNNLNFVDAYERFNAVDKPEDMMIYISPSGTDVSPSSDMKNQYILAPALLSNDPFHERTDLHINNYNSIINTTKLSKGSDRIIASYSMEHDEALNYLLQDGDQKRDLFLQHEYLGEVYTKFDYMHAKTCRNMMVDKMKEEVIEVVVDNPLLALSRGSKVNMEWYDINSNLIMAKQNNDIHEDDIETNIPLGAPKELEDKNPTYRINKQVSGQYYILSSVISYEDKQWSNTIRMTRPRDRQNKYIEPVKENETK